jgi:hypothetical protein
MKNWGCYGAIIVIINIEKVSAVRLAGVLN